MIYLLLDRSSRKHTHEKGVFSIILVIVVLICCLLNMCTALSEALFSPGEAHTSTLDFRQYFETISATQGACTMSIHQDIYQEDQAQKLWKIVQYDLQALSSLVEMEAEQFEPFTIFVVQETFLGVERYDDRLYCTAGDIESGAYRQALTGVALGIEEYWKTLGLQNCLLDAPVDIAQLKAAYEQASDLDRLSMFISYFTEPFASAEESALAQQTATAITRYILEHYGIDALARKDDIAYKQGWLQSIGVDRIYSDPYAQVLQDYRFTKANGYALVAITSLNHRFYLQPMEDMQTAKDVRIFLYEAAAYSQSLLDLFREEAPDYYKTVKSRWEGQLNIFCNTGGGSYVQPTARKVKLQLSYAYMHELTHILHPTPKNIRYATEILPYEGLCEYVSSLFPFYSNTRMCYEDVLCKYQHTGDAAGEGKSPNADNRKYWARVTEIYLANAAMPASIEEMDMALFIHAQVLAPMRYAEELKNSIWSSPLLRLDSDGFTSFQAGSFTGYLIRQSSLNTYLDYCAGIKTFEQAFGLSFEEAKENWYTYVEKDML